MKKFLKKKLGNEKGMTLIELLAVIVILAIIAAIAIPAIGNIIENSRVGAIKSDASNALQAAELLLIDEPDKLDTVGSSIVMTDLESDYLDDAGSFDGDTTFNITKTSTGQLVLTGIGTIGSVVVDFDTADKGTINGLPNNSDVAAAGGTNTAIVTGR